MNCRKTHLWPKKLIRGIQCFCPLFQFRLCISDCQSQNLRRKEVLSSFKAALSKGSRGLKLGSCIQYIKTVACAVIQASHQ